MIIHGNNHVLKEHFRFSNRQLMNRMKRPIQSAKPGRATKSRSLCRRVFIVGLLLSAPLLNFKVHAVPGDLDLSFGPGTGVGSTPSPTVFSVALQPDGKMLIGGEFTSFNGVNRNYLARLNPNGSLDTGFVPAAVTNGTVQSIVVQSDGELIVGGFFFGVNAITRNFVGRLNGDGSLDSGFDPGHALGVGLNHGVYAVARQADGKVLVGGAFDSYSGTARKAIARLNTSGSLDAGFNSASGAGGAFPVVFCVLVQPDGQVLIGGTFDTFNGVSRTNIARLNADGTLDSTFNSGTGAAGPGGAWVTCMALQPDGRVLIGGRFNSINATPRNKIARLNTNGSLDTSFDPGTGTGSDNQFVQAVAVQLDGKIVVGGGFDYFNNSYLPGIARLNPNGSVDAGFAPGSGAAAVQSIALQTNGGIIIGGFFPTYNGITRNGIARLFAGPVITNQPTSQSAFVGTSASFSVAAASPTSLSYQWRFNGATIGGATAANLPLSNVQGTNAGNYDVIVTDASGSVTSSVAVLTVTATLNVSAQGGMVCLSPDQTAYPLGTTVRLTAIPFAGWVFNFWTPGLSPANPQLLTLSSNTYVTANFSRTPASCVLAPVGGLSFWWRAENDPDDAVNAFRGTLLNGATYGAGKVGQAFRFDGADDRMVLAAFCSLIPSTEITIEFWQKVDAVKVQSTFSQVGFVAGQICNAHIPYSDGKVYWDFGDINNGGRLSYTPPESLVGTWQHFALVASQSGNYMRIYRNGVLEAQKTGMTPLAVSYADFAIGGAAGLSFGGLLDEFTIYASALDPQDVLDVYNAGVQGKCPWVIPPPKSGLISWWPGEGNAMDIIGAHTGMRYVGVTFAPGMVGQAFNFDGVNGYISVPDSPDLNPPSALTIEAWIKTSGTPSYSRIVGKFDDASNTGYGLGLHNDGTMRSDIGIGGGSYTVASNPKVVIDGQWHHVASVFNGSQGVLYVDGVPGPTIPLTGIATTSSQPLAIGRDLCCPGRFFHGLIDEVSLYSRALSAVEIQRIYEAGSSGKCLNDFRITGISRAPGSGTLTWEAEPSFNYRVQYKTNASDPIWININGDVNATDTSAIKSDSNLGNAPRRFYRVQRLP